MRTCSYLHTIAPRLLNKKKKFPRATLPFYRAPLYCLRRVYPRTMSVGARERGRNCRIIRISDSGEKFLSFILLAAHGVANSFAKGSIKEFGAQWCVQVWRLLRVFFGFFFFDRGYRVGQLRPGVKVILECEMMKRCHLQWDVRLSCTGLLFVEICWY